jgi:hypothetical protein
VAIFAKIDKGKRRRIARAPVSIDRGGTKTVKLKVNRRAFRVLGRRGRLKAKVRARANGRSASKTVSLKR